MKTRSLSLVLCGALALLFPALASAQPLPVQTVEFKSDSVGRTMKYNIVLPAKYEQGMERFPVLYLLHGLTGNYTNWAQMKVPAYARNYDLIVVMPDAGNSWYLNWAKSDEGQKNNWEDAIVKDLVGHVDANYRTIARREGRAINGLSMGGFGGLMLGLRHPELFCTIGSHSGAVAYVKTVGERIRTGNAAGKKKGNKAPSTTPDPKIGIEGFSSQADRSPKGQMLTTPEECAAYDPFALVLKLPREKLPYICFDCGTEDFVYKDNAALATLLLENKIPHTFSQSAGKHDGAYWSREVGLSMAVQYVIMHRQLATVKTDDKQKSAKETKTPVKTGLHINTPKAFRGYTLFAPLNSTKIYLIDMDGKVAHTWEGASRPAGCPYLLENGHLLLPCVYTAKKTPFGLGGGSGGRIQELTWDGELVWDYQLANDKQLAHHDIHKLPNGNVLILAGEIKTPDDVLAAGCQTKVGIRADYLVEVKPMGKTGGAVIWQWHMWDHLVQDADKDKANFGDVAKHPELVDVNFGLGGKGAKKGGEAPKSAVDWTHSNAVDYNADLDQIMLSNHNFSEVYVIDHGTTTAEAAGHTGGKHGKGGDLLYRWGNPLVHRAGKADDQQLYVQHNSHWIPKDVPGGGHALVFNNGSSRLGAKYSSVDEFVLPLDPSGNYAEPTTPAKPTQVAWTYFAPNKADFLSFYISGAQRLPNGNTLICSGANGIFFEVTPDKEIVWKYVNPMQKTGGPGSAPTPGAVFRAYRYALDYSAFAGKTLQGGQTVEEMLASERPTP